MLAVVLLPVDAPAHPVLGALQSMPLLVVVGAGGSTRTEGAAVQAVFSALEPVRLPPGQAAVPDSPVDAALLPSVPYTHGRGGSRSDYSQRAYRQQRGSDEGSDVHGCFPPEGWDRTIPKRYPSVSL